MNDEKTGENKGFSGMEALAGQKMPKTGEMLMMLMMLMIVLEKVFKTAVMLMMLMMLMILVGGGRQGREKH